MGLPRGSLELVTGPATEPVTVAEAKLHGRIEHSADDTLIEGFITGARQLVERLTNRALITQTWKLTLDAWPGEQKDEWFDGMREMPITATEGELIEVRKAPFLAITSVVTLDESDASTTYASSNYYVTKRNAGTIGVLVKKTGSVWPSIVSRAYGAIVITFTAGYGAGASDVPIALRQAIKDIVLHWYENREAASEVNLQEPPMKTRSILQQYTVAR
jgi:uncharacterized phiE125 gp8 family phage protein